MAVGRKRTYNYIFYILGGFIAFNIVWYAFSVFLQLKALPSPLEVYAGYSKAIDNGVMQHALTSFRRVFIGLSVSLVLGLLLGLLMGYNRKANKLLGPLLYFTYPVPKLALLPVVMILFGVEEASKIIIIVLIIVFQLILSIRDAVRAIPKEDYSVLTSLRANSLTKMRHITFPAILPSVLSSLRVSLGIAISALFFTETFGTAKGLGLYINDSWMRIDYVQMYFGIFVLSLMGFLLFLILDLSEKYFCKWKDV